jgi:ribonuclease BN (tRNA processing enzyme)
VKYGGNTPCIEIRYGDDNGLVIIDAGTGIKGLSDAIMSQRAPAVGARLFFTHTHWDHVMGFPFFAPIFVEGTNLDIYSPVTHEEEGLEAVIGTLLSYRHFPVLQSELSASIRYHGLKEDLLEFEDGLRIQTKFLNHPVLTLGYRVEYGGKSFCTVFDHEPFRNVFPVNPHDPDYDAAAAEEGEAIAKEENAKVIKFFSNADLLIHDTQYTQREYLASKVGWGHSTYEHAINAAHKGRVKQLLFYHHDPLRKDEELEKLEKHYQGMVAGKTDMSVQVAREGMVFDL